MKQHICRNKLLLSGIDTAFLLFAAVLITFALPDRALAYVDPSVMTYTIQAIAGVAVALSAVAGVAFRRSRRAIMRFLNIDENAGKDVDPPVYRVDAQGNLIDASGTAGAVGTVTSVSSPENPAATGADSHPSAPLLPWRKRFIFALITSVFALFTLFVLAPYEIMAASTGSLVFRLTDIAVPVALTAAVLALIIALALSALREKAFSVACAAVFAIGLGCWLQAMFLNTGLPTADGNAVIWSDFAGISTISTIVWVVVIAGSIAAALLVPRKARGVMTVLAVALILVQGVGAASLFTSSQPSSETSRYIMTEDGLFTVSPTNNVIVFILDDYDTRFLQEAVATQPTLLDEMEGFTWFTNSTGSMIPTRYGLPFLFTAQYPRTDEKFSHYLDARYDRSNYLDDLAKSGYSIGIYSDTLGLEYLSDEHAAEVLYSKTINFHTFRQPPMNVPGTLRALATCALYRDLPWILKPFFWFYTDEINTAMIQRNENAQQRSGSVSASGNASTSGRASRQNGIGERSEIPYSTNDSRWYRQLKRAGLSFDDRGEVGAFRFIHLLGAHYPYSVDPTGEDVGLDRSNRNDQAQGSINMVNAYLRELKELGVYDSTTIIITADHGDWYITPNPLTEPASPIMLAKPAHAPHVAITTSDAPICAADVLPTVIDAIGLPSDAYGETLFELQLSSDPMRPRYYMMTTSDGAHDQEIIEYEIVGDALDMNNWHLTGNVWNAQE